MRRIFLVAASVLFLAGCATHQTYVSEPIRLLQTGQIEAALQKLEPLANQDSKDQLVFLMEYGTVLHIAGRYKESIQAFIKADKLADELDYHSVSKIAVATLGSEEMLQYKGESYEKLLINAYLSMNFLALGDYDASMVEVRRINDKIKKFRSDGREDYELNPFSSYLSALIWEGDQKYDDAYIAFEKTYELDASNPLLAQDLIRSAKLAKRMEAYNQWKKKFPEVVEDPSWYDKKMGQAILIYQQGWGPRKTFSYEDHRFPRLIPQMSTTQKARLMVAGKENKTADSQIVYNVEQVAIRTLQADYSYMMLRKLGAFAAKEVVADQIRQKDELLGAIARIAMHLSDRADLRQWASLPETIQMARIYLPAGEYTVSVQGLLAEAGTVPSPDSLEEKKIKIKPGRKTFVTWRSLR